LAIFVEFFLNVLNVQILIKKKINSKIQKSWIILNFIFGNNKDKIQKQEAAASRLTVNSQVKSLAKKKRKKRKKQRQTEEEEAAPAASAREQKEL